MNGECTIRMRARTRASVRTNVRCSAVLKWSEWDGFCVDCGRGADALLAFGPGMVSVWCDCDGPDRMSEHLAGDQMTTSRGSMVTRRPMASVWLVTRGYYSDYSVSGVFSTRELAEQWIGGMPDYVIEERPLDQMDNAPRPGLHAGISLSDSSDVFVEAWTYRGDNRVRVCRKYVGERGPAMIYAYFDHTNRERAIKVLSEMRAALMARNYPPWTGDEYTRDLTLISRDYVRGEPWKP